MAGQVCCEPNTGRSGVRAGKWCAVLRRVLRGLHDRIAWEIHPVMKLTPHRVCLRAKPAAILKVPLKALTEFADHLPLTRIPTPMGEQNIRIAIDRHWAASATGDQVAEHQIYHYDIVCVRGCDLRLQAALLLSSENLTILGTSSRIHAFRRNLREQRLRQAQRCGEVAVEAVLIHKHRLG